ncbi:MAG: DUF4960 domain-containing protein [Muribaculaceae bacterium]|nr:DUF4960 domain-containing protein [Muribaculaceae bacterium]
MKTKYNYISALAAGLIAVTGCQDKDYEISDPIIAPVTEEALKGELIDDNYVWSWTPSEGKAMQVTVLRDGQMLGSETSSTGSYVHHDVETKVPYTYIFKLTDGSNFSKGVIKSYTRNGADPVSNVTLAQIEKENAAYDAQVEWQTSGDATEQLFVATSGSRTLSETLAPGIDSYIISNVLDGEEWNVTITASNADGRSLPATGSLKIGKTAIGFLSEYPTEEDLIAGGDDDEACAWLWLKSEYPAASYVYFGDIASSKDLEPYRVLFWIRDLENRPEDDVFNMPSVVNDATPFVKEWYAAGGNLLLWSHATAYVGTLGRLETDMLRSNDRSIGLGSGGWNGDTWMMAVQLHPGSRFKKDFSTHPIYKGLDITETDRTKLIAFKGAGWTEDHNCLYFNIPSVLTGLGNQEEACYIALTQTYGIYPLGTWDSQIDWVSQLNVWEARQGNTEFKGTVLCIGNGGCEFSLKNADGTPDISAYPKNNPYQGNVLKLAKNSLEYLKTR